MKEQIVENIERLSLHDSHIQEIVRNEDEMTLILDWAKLENYSEANIQEGIILGKCELTFEGMKNEKLRIDFAGTPDKRDVEPKEIPFDAESFQDWLILENKANPNNNYCLSGFFDFEGSDPWLNWSFSFSGFRLGWNNAVTWEEWKAGKLVEE